MKSIDYRHVLLVILSIIVAGIAAKYPALAPFLSALVPVAASVGIYLPQPGAPPPSAGPLAVLLVLAGFSVSACTLTQQRDAGTVALDVVQCIAQQTALQPTPAPEAIALTCGVTAAPDVLVLIEDLIAQKAARAASLAHDGGK